MLIRNGHAMHYRVVLFLLFLTGSLVCAAQTLVLPDHGRADVNGQLSYLRDTTLALGLDDVRGMLFERVHSDYSPNIGFDRAAHWFKLEIKNESETPEWLLEVAYSPLDQIDLYLVGPNGASSLHKVAGDHFPISQRDLPHRHPIFAFSITPGQSSIIYLRVHTISSVQVPLTFWHRDAFLKTSYKVQLFNGLFYGAMLLMFLYQLFLFLSVRDRITFYYVLTLLTMVNVVSFFHGYSFFIRLSRKSGGQ